ncbi:hypothetical protein KCP71_01335 [Salmonella enterica subsp. enterica]|nr:hypothetical protein KCP71_01335 [Salmonella enterica subsp. enterica]
MEKVYEELETRCFLGIIRVARIPVSSAPVIDKKSQPSLSQRRAGKRR